MMNVTLILEEGFELSFCKIFPWKKIDDAIAYLYAIAMLSN